MDAGRDRIHRIPADRGFGLRDGVPARDVVKVAVLTGSVLAAVLAAVVLRARNRHYRAVFELETADSDHDGVPDVPADSRGGVRRLDQCSNRSAVPLICSVFAGSAQRTGREIRQFLVHKVAATGGHLGPNLGGWSSRWHCTGCSTPHDPIIFDTGHQAYVHKMLTGRSAGSTPCGARAGCPVTRRAPRASTTGWSPATRRRRCPTPTGGQGLRAERAATGTSSPSSVTAR